ncbi:MAG: ABC transporter ATP-binding protein [Hamadaea sp.]|uniref:ABC transporter ATP-binding protein n=1 Tax=Hamadaea sp. TaxID=2024425 RepID=UPI001823E357|nr:ABC transporter ATP-binding protein [Hamadaea sp.]NUR73400.1 ABC transporter ATP-binding protein [Hamadaea sp.]NUT18547.1 ABC transporter ATP-binding protein [Hamadaea sp.]
MTSTVTVRLTAVRKTYGTPPAAVTALAGVSAEFTAGSFTAVMGASGSGKSTLLHCAAGLDIADSGTVTIGDTDLAGLNEHGRTLLRRDRIGFVFQAYNLVGALTAAQNVALPHRLARRALDPAEVTRALAEVGLADRAGHYPAQLSGGEQQRVALARALITRPAVLYADEPTGALDSASSGVVLRALRGLVDTHGQTVVMVTHDAVAAAAADRVLVLADGQIVDEITGADPARIAARLVRAEVRA